MALRVLADESARDGAIFESLREHAGRVAALARAVRRSPPSTSAGACDGRRLYLALEHPDGHRPWPRRCSARRPCTRSARCGSPSASPRRWSRLTCSGSCTARLTPQNVVLVGADEAVKLTQFGIDWLRATRWLGRGGRARGRRGRLALPGAGAGAHRRGDAAERCLRGGRHPLRGAGWAGRPPRGCRRAGAAASLPLRKLRPDVTRSLERRRHARAGARPGPALSRHDGSSSTTSGARSAPSRAPRRRRRGRARRHRARRRAGRAWSRWASSSAVVMVHRAAELAPRRRLRPRPSPSRRAAAPQPEPHGLRPRRRPRRASPPRPRCPLPGRRRPRPRRVPSGRRARRRVPSAARPTRAAAALRSAAPARGRNARPPRGPGAAAPRRRGRRARRRSPAPARPQRRRDRAWSRRRPRERRGAPPLRRLRDGGERQRRHHRLAA